MKILLLMLLLLIVVWFTKGTSSIPDDDAYWNKHTLINQAIEATDAKTCEGEERIIYRFGEAVMDQSSVSMTTSSMTLSAFKQAIELPAVNPYEAYY